MSQLVDAWEDLLFELAEPNPSADVLSLVRVENTHANFLQGIVHDVNAAIPSNQPVATAVSMQGTLAFR